MKTKEFKTKTSFTKRKNPSFNNNAWVVALDIGYSAVKGMSENMVYSFPSYAKKLRAGASMLGEASPHEILYRDCETNEVWIVGANAQAMVSIEDSNDSLSSLYGRNRYFSDIFKICSRTGIGMGLLDNEFGSACGKELFVQTGLPPLYLTSDVEFLKESLSGEQKFELKIGNNPWVTITYNLPESNVRVMSQPKGTLISISTLSNGMPCMYAEKYLKSRLLILDPGFGTSDNFLIKNNMQADTQTFDNLGMKQIFQDTSDEILKKYGVEIPVPAMQSYLESGEIMKFDRKNRKTIPIDFTSILEKCSKAICMKNMEKLNELYNYLIELDYLVITGGTGAAWSNYIRDYLKEMHHITILSGNQNDILPYIFSNVRGYYMFMARSLARK